MPPGSRLGDKAQAPVDAHGCVACPHPVVGPAVSGSTDVMTNKLPAIRKGDTGIHAVCCGTNTWKTTAGSASVFINNKEAVRVGDQTKHCGGNGQMIEGSGNVMIGGGSSGGGGSGGGGASSSAQGGGGTSSSVGSQSGINSNQTGSGGGGGAGAAGGAAAAGGAGGAAANENEQQAAEEKQKAEEQKKKDEDPNVHVVAADLTSPGGQPLGFELVQLIKKGKDGKPEIVAGPELTDVKGHIAFVVDEEGEYEFEVLTDDNAEHVMPPPDSEVSFALHCEFLDDGVPLAGETVKVSGPGFSGSEKLDEGGQLLLAVGAGEYELTINGQKFHAHAVRSADHNGIDSFHVDNATDKKADFAKARANRYSPATKGEK